MQSRKSRKLFFFTSELAEVSSTTRAGRSFAHPVKPQRNVNISLNVLQPSTSCYLKWGNLTLSLLLPLLKKKLVHLCLHFRLVEGKNLCTTSCYARVKRHSPEVERSCRVMVEDELSLSVTRVINAKS